MASLFLRSATDDHLRATLLSNERALASLQKRGNAKRWRETRAHVQQLIDEQHAELKRRGIDA